MALDKAFLTGVIDGITDEQAEKILKEYGADLTGLKVNRDELKTEKEKIEARYKELEAGAAGYQKTIRDLEEKIKSSGTEETKAFYEAEKQKIQDMYASKLKDHENTIEGLKAEKTKLTSEYHDHIYETELESAIRESKVEPDWRIPLFKLFKGQYKFDMQEVEGVKKFVCKDHQYKNVKDVLTDYLGTDEGKRFLRFDSSGGGAPGSSNQKSNAGNPWAKDSINLTDQARITRENPALAATYKAAAGVPV